jgi:alginate O-acetyltransferase complex protein AlgI
MVTFSLCGLWHGAGWNFVLWGTIHGAMLAVYHMIKSVSRSGRSLPKPVAVFLTLVAVQFAWIPFRIKGLDDVAYVWTGMLGFQGLGWGDVSITDAAFVLLLTLFAVVAPNASQRWPGSSGFAESLLLWFAALWAVLNTPQISSFIYFRF